MIKYLTEKLKQHTLDEHRIDCKIEENDYDSGTESDDQIPYTAIMISNENDRCNAVVGNFNANANRNEGCCPTSTVTPASSPYFLDSAVPSDCDLTYDHHSSEEELEVINGSKSAIRNITSSATTISKASSSAKTSSAKRASRSAFGTRCRSVCSMLPEKRKWSDAMDAESPISFLDVNVAAAASVDNNSSSNSNSPSTICTRTAISVVDGRLTPSHRSRLKISNRHRASPASDENSFVTGRKCLSGCDRKLTANCNSAASSDDESIVTTTTPSYGDAFTPIAPSTPVNFSRTPPLNTHKPPTIRSLSPPLKTINCGDDSAAPLVKSFDAIVDHQQQQRSQNVSSSPRYKRHRLTPTQRSHHAHNIQRPCLDFEKMQQMKENAVTTWRHHHNGSEHSGELSLYCW